MFSVPTSLPDDPVALQLILRAAAAEIERLRLLIANLQRSRFGRRSERLDDEQLEQGIDDLEQSLAEQQAGLDAALGPAKPDVPDPAPQPASAAASRRVARAFAQGRGGNRAQRDRLSVLRRFAARDWRRPRGDARLRAIPVAREVDPPPTPWLSRLRGRRASGTGAGVAERLHGDDTTVLVLARGKTITGRLWVYVRDDLPFGGGAPPGAIFHYSPDRGGKHPCWHLEGYAGILQADAYTGFNDLYHEGRKPWSDYRGGVLGPRATQTVRARRCRVSA